MKNAYALKQSRAVLQSYQDGVWHGIRTGLNVCAIALNRSHGFGKKRIEQLEVEVNRLLEDICKMHPDQVDSQIERALEQIRGPENSEE